MLVLSRCIGEKIYIERDGKELTLTVTRVSDNHGRQTVRLGFESEQPTDFVITRKELRDKEQEEIRLEAEKLLS